MLIQGREIIPGDIWEVKGFGLVLVLGFFASEMRDVPLVRVFNIQSNVVTFLLFTGRDSSYKLASRCE